MTEIINKFPDEILDELKFYVYRLIDPTNGETFYVGKGTGNRVFAHINEELDANKDSEKLDRIRKIRLEGFEVDHIIHRHGMGESTAVEVESALIDCYPGLTNEVRGSGSNAVGVMHAKQIVKMYKADVAEFKHKLLLINVNQSATDSDVSLYNATRYAWRIDTARAEKADYILSVVKGMIVGIFVAEKWLPINEDNFPELEPNKDRHGFIGNEAPQEIKEQYIGKRIPDDFRKQGASNPIKYTYS